MNSAYWNYSGLAGHYSTRPEYAGAALDALISAGRAGPGATACDIGAGPGHLTIPLLDRGLDVDAVEPNDEMRAIGAARTAGHERVRWNSGTGEDTGLPEHAYDLVTFGSSFNVVDPALALAESARLLRADGWFACMWNHRDLDDPLQRAIEELILRRIPDYSYGDRRRSQTETINASGRFGSVIQFESPVEHVVDTNDWCDAWRSHATLARQAGDRFEAIVDEISVLVRASAGSRLTVPYTTRMWMAKVSR